MCIVPVPKRVCSMCLVIVPIPTGVCVVRMCSKFCSDFVCSEVCMC
jgi:hypothetical protein